MAKQTFTTGQVLTAAQMTSLQQTAMGGGSATAKTTSYVLVAADAGGTVAMNAAGATTITVNTGLFAAGDTVFIQNLGAGACTVTAGTATVATAGSLILPQNDAGILYFTATGASIFYDYIQAGAVSPLTTKGDVYTFSTSDARLAVGTNTHVLTADSAEATGLKWAAVAGGSLTVLASGSLPASTQLSLTSISGSYKNLKLYFNCGSLTANSVLSVNFNADYANVYINSGVRQLGGTAAVYGSNAGEGIIQCSQNLNAASAFYSLNMDIYQYASTDNMRVIGINSGFKDSSPTIGSLVGTIGFNRATAITQIDINSNNGNFSSGSYILYGVN